MDSDLTAVRDSPAATLAQEMAPLPAILCTEELWRRPARAPDHETENRALAALVQSLADAPETILQRLADTLLDVFKADSAGLSLLEEDGERFYWPAIAGGWKPHLGGGTPRNFGPCGDVLDCNAPLLFRRWDLRYPYLREVTPLAAEGLLVPFHVGGKAVGTVWAISHNDRRRFDAEDLRQLESFGRFASAAYQAVELRRADDMRRAAEQRMEQAVRERETLETLNVSLRESERRQRLLIAELNHRVKNTLATVQSIAAHTLTGAPDAARRAVFEERLIALSRTHDLLARASWERAGLCDVLQQALAPFQGEGGRRVTLEGPDVALPPKAVLALGLAFHELATNAVKYGALSTPQGQVRVAWEIAASSAPARLRLHWTETGGPAVRDTGRRGCGWTVIQRGVALELDGQAAMRLDPGGLVCAIDIPLPTGSGQHGG